MHPNARLLQDFYSAFQRRDAAAMAACYHPDVHFRDEVFDLVEASGRDDIRYNIETKISPLVDDTAPYRSFTGGYDYGDGFVRAMQWPWSR